LAGNGGYCPECDRDGYDSIKKVQRLGLFLFRIISEKHTHLELNGIERLRTYAVTPFGGQHLEITIGVPSEYLESFFHGIDNPVMR
jgi:hypothetical protein